MLIYAVDLGSTNIKVALYDEQLRQVAVEVRRAVYSGLNPIVEFDPDAWFEQVITLIGACARSYELDTAFEPAVISLTGQAESLVILDGERMPVRPAISWRDSRSVAESADMSAHFGEKAFAVTGQPLATLTWPATKLLWLRRNEPRTLERAAHVLMIKDYLQMRLTGQVVGELSTRAFTYLFDVSAADYWDDMLEFCGVGREQMPALVAPGSDIGEVLPQVQERLPPSARWSVNVGALDHFASMIGTGSYCPGLVTESAGTVLSLSMLVAEHRFDPGLLVSYHRGARGDDYVLYDCCDSGAVCMEWFKGACLPGSSYSWLEEQLSARSYDNAPLFLPHLTGINPPEFYMNAKGAFFDLSLGHDVIDMSYAVMEGVAHLLRSNLEYCAAAVGKVDGLTSAGGGSVSAFWTQLKANVCNTEVAVPYESEVACRGAAVLALVSARALGDIDDARHFAPLQTRVFSPTNSAVHQDRYRRYSEVLRQLYG